MDISRSKKSKEEILIIARIQFFCWEIGPSEIFSPIKYICTFFLSTNQIENNNFYKYETEYENDLIEFAPFSSSLLELHFEKLNVDIGL